MDPEKLLALTEALGLTKEEALAISERAAREKQKRYERERQKEERERKIQELKEQLAEYASHGPITERSERAGSVSPGALYINPKKLMEPFDESRDDVDAYLRQFERIAACQGLERSELAMALSLLLEGAALSIFERMPSSDSNDYDKVKIALLQRFRLGAEEFRQKFRQCKPEDAETGRQFAARLSNYFDSWIELSGTERTYEAIRNRIIGEQFLNCCNADLVDFLKERRLQALDDLAESTDAYIEEQGLENLGEMKVKPDKKPELNANTPETRDCPTGSRLPRTCFSCDGVGHLPEDCRTNNSGGKADLVCNVCYKRGHETEDCRFRTKDKAGSVLCPQIRTPGHQQDYEGREQDKAEAVVVCSAIDQLGEETSMLQVPSFQPLTLTPSELEERQKQDPSLRGCHVQEGTQWRRNHTLYEFQVINGLLYRRCQFNSGREAMQLVVPRELRHAILATAHENVVAGHRRLNPTLRRITEEFFWPNIQSDTRRYVKSCQVCRPALPPLIAEPRFMPPFQRKIAQTGPRQLANEERQVFPRRPSKYSRFYNSRVGTAQRTLVYENGNYGRKQTLRRVKIPHERLPQRTGNQKIAHVRNSQGSGFHKMEL